MHMCFESKMWNQDEEGVLNLGDDYVNYDDFPSFTPDQEEGVGGGGGSDNYTNVMDELVSMNLLDANHPALFGEQDNDPILQIDQHNHVGEQSCQDLAMVFFEWLKSNKESISAKDLRNIKLKKSTIESAVKTLGGGKEGMNKLLKLILEWVQNHQLRKKKKIREEQNTSYHMELPQYPNLTSNPYSVPSMPQWAPHQQPCASESAAVYPPMMYGYAGGESFYNNGVISSAQSWPPPNSATHYIDFSDQNRSPSPLPHVVPPVETMYFASSGSTPPCQLYPSPDDGLVNSGASSTKEARKKRMGARQKRVFSQGQSFIDHQHQQLHDTNWPLSPLDNETNCTNTSQLPNWQLHWPSPTSANAFPSPVPVSEPSSEPPPPPPIQGGQQTIHSRQYHQHSSLDRQKVCKTGPGENLRFLMQKVLRQSDVGGLGRIVLPKKEAEAFLPSLEGRDGIYIPMEDAATTKIWNMLYRSWPNNKNRLYMLENAGEFVRSNELREGDFIVIYSDIKCDKYLIRGVKVRQSEAAKQGKAHTNSTFTIPSSSSAKRTVQ